MNRHSADQIAARMSLRAPQRRSLQILDRITELVPLKKGGGPKSALAAIQNEFPMVTNFERGFPSVCFALATGVGKTRLMGAFVSYLRLAHGLNNFFVLAPNLTIYNKLITDFSQGTPKYVLKGIGEFVIAPPIVITGESFHRHMAGGDPLFPTTTINIFNISKINSEVRGGRMPRIRNFREEFGESYFDYLARLPNLVLIMDESHRYRASAGVRALNELMPVMGLELTATPFVETTRGTKHFRNVIYDYTMAQAIEDRLVKEPAVVTRENFVATGKPPDVIESIKLQDGVRLHESVKLELEAYARENGKPIIKPLMLVIARHTAHASRLMRLIKSRDFFEGRYTIR